MTSSELMREGLTSLKIPINEDGLEKLLLYLKELQKWSKRINLIGQGSGRDIIEKHFLDSLTVVPYLEPCPPPGLIDVGSGAGFPGLPLKIAHPDIQVKLVEPRSKRASFLRHIIRTLDLDKTEVIEHRLEEDHPVLTALHTKTPLLISRAVSDIPTFLPLCRPFCNEGGRVICMKGPKAELELSEWQKENAAKDGFTLTARHHATLPFSGISRDLLIFTYNKG